MSESLKAPNIRELSVPLVGRQFACVAKSMDGAADPKTADHLAKMPPSEREPRRHRGSLSAPAEPESRRPGIAS